MKSNPEKSNIYDRREFVIGTATAGILIGLPLSGCTTNDEAQKLYQLLDIFMVEQFARSPELATSLGLDVGDLAWARNRLGGTSADDRRKNKAANGDRLKRLEAIDAKALSGMDAINHAAIYFATAAQARADRLFSYGGPVGLPYVLSPYNGAYGQIPDFLDSQHPVEDAASADGYLDRLLAFANVLDGEIDQVREDAAQGVIPPNFAIDQTLGQMRDLHKSPASSSLLVTSLARRTVEKKIDGDYEARAASIYDAKVRPALARQIALMVELRNKAVHDVGVWRLPQGRAYYAASLLQATSTDITAGDIHRTGLDLVRSLTSQIDTFLTGKGLSSGTVGERLRALYWDRRFLYPNDDGGREKLILDLRLKIKAVEAKLPSWFATLPKAKVEVRRIPQYVEATRPDGYYMAPSLDGARPGTYYINLRDTSEAPSWALPTLTYHEAIPGHHLQVAIQQETNLPLARKIIDYNAYSEGWALYAEQLADEMGLYADDPWGRIGMLRDAMIRAVRLVVDSGMHAMEWSRERAIAYFADTLGMPDTISVTEIERYAVMPGQACGYMIGKLAILGEREKAETALGSAFDIRQFHDACLTNGPVPLDLLTKIISDHIRSVRQRRN